MFTEECLIIRSSKQVGQAVSPAIFGGSHPAGETPAPPAYSGDVRARIE
jgi:hypothetical protein